jgi:hypothetical protein
VTSTRRLRYVADADLGLLHSRVRRRLPSTPKPSRRTYDLHLATTFCPILNGLSLRSRSAHCKINNFKIKFCLVIEVSVSQTRGRDPRPITGSPRAHYWVARELNGA